MPQRLAVLFGGAGQLGRDRGLDGFDRLGVARGERVLPAEPVGLRLGAEPLQEYVRVRLVPVGRTRSNRIPSNYADTTT